MEPGLLRHAATLAESGVACAVAVVAETRGSVPGKVGATMLVWAPPGQPAQSRGTVGGAGLEERVKALCRDALAKGAGGLHEFDLANWKPAGLDSVCGGSVRIAIHVVGAAPRLLLVGGGHCAQALAQTCDMLGYAYDVVDSRAEYARSDAFPRAGRVEHESPAAFIHKSADLSSYSHAYLLGHSHHEDGDALIALLQKGYHGHIGVIGSRSKMRAFRDRALKQGLPEEALERVRSPIGVDVGAQTPPEIAIAVAAEIIRDARQARAATEPKETIR